MSEIKSFWASVPGALTLPSYDWTKYEGLFAAPGGTYDAALSVIAAGPSEEAPRETSAHLNTLVSPKLSLRRPIAIVVEFDAEGAIARWPEVLLEGHGSSEDEAIQNLREEIVDAFFEVSDAVDRGKRLVGYPSRLFTILSDLCSAK